MPVEVSDVRSNPADQIRHAAIVLRRSKPRRDVFSAICRGKKKSKTVSELHEITGLPEIRVYQEAGNLADNQIVEKTKIKTGNRTEIAYTKDPFFCRNKQKILSLAVDRKKLAKLATKVTPQSTESRIRVFLPAKMVSAKRIDVDSIDSFNHVRTIHSVNSSSVSIYERRMKKGLSKLLGEKGRFQDWGGETDDLYSTRLRIGSKRLAVAMGLKGRGTSGILVPKKMGKRGDQIQRLFRSPAEVFLIQYNGQIDETIIEQMHAFAVAKSFLEGKKIYYGVIDGEDSQRLISAYSNAFR
jgi:hypothetical protein